MSHKNPPNIIPRLFIFIGLVLSIQFLTIFITIKNNTQYKPRAQNTTCPDPTGTENYESIIMPIGPNIAANNNPANYLQIRKLYNCQNTTLNAVKTSFIPTTVIYDLNFLKNGSEAIKQNLLAMKKYGLYPIIRVATYMGQIPGCSEDCWTKPYNPTTTDENVVSMATNLSKALNEVNGFPDKPVVVFLNEVNLNTEWQGEANPKEFAKSFYEFYSTMKTGNFFLFFPPLSYGANIENGITPSQFLSEFFDAGYFNQTKYINGAAFNIYGESYESIKQQFAEQMDNISSYKNYFYTTIGRVITELGPVVRGSALYQCQSMKDQWESSAGTIVNSYISDQGRPGIATMACFGDITYPAIVNYQINSQQTPLITLEEYGQIENNGDRTPTSTPPLRPSGYEGQATPTGTTSADITVNLKLKFQGVAKKPKNSQTSIKVKITSPTITTPIEKILSVTCDNNGIWSGVVKINVSPANDFTFYIKGPKHLQKRVCKNNPTETKPGEYTCETGTIALQKGVSSLDFSKIILLTGDLPPQDGLINQDDLTVIRENLGKKDVASIQKADVNFDGIIDTQDWSLVMATLKITNGDDE